MKIKVVETEDGEPYILWGPAILLTGMLALLASGGAYGLYYLLTGTPSPFAAIVGLAAVLTAMTRGIRKALRAPPQAGARNLDHR